MSGLCNDGMFLCVFEAVTGVGLGVIVVLFAAAMVGLVTDKLDDKS